MHAGNYQINKYWVKYYKIHKVLNKQQQEITRRCSNLILNLLTSILFKEK